MKPLTDFHRSKRHPQGRYPWCKDCKNARSAGYYKRWTDEQREKHKRRVAAWRYGLSAEEYDELIFGEEARCAICGGQDSRRGRLCVDHNHQTGKVRGALCTDCNLAIGYLRDDPELFRKAAAYLGGQ